MATQTYGGLSAEQKTFYDRTLLNRLEPTLVYQKYGQKKSIPSNEGDTVSFRRFNALPANTVPLTEGVTPAGKALDITAITATVNQYGDFVEISDKLDMMGIDPVLTETAKMLGEQAGLTLDIIVRDNICNGTNVQYAGGKASANAITANDKMTATEIAKAVRTLRNANAKPGDGRCFIGIIDDSVAFDLMQDPLWQDVSKYNGGVKIENGEIGKLNGVRFITTSNTIVKANTQTPPVKVHTTMIIGKDAYGVIDVNGMAKPEMIVKTNGSSGTADPLNQRSTSAWKACMTAKRLNELAMLRIESAVTE